MLRFVIPVRDGEPYIAQCLEQIQRERRSGDEVVLVDNGSTDSTVEIARGFDGVEILERPGVTIAALRNAGAAGTQAELLGFIDADCVLVDGWRERVDRRLRDETIAATGSRYDLPPRPVWVERAWYSRRPSPAKPVTYINSGNLIVRRAAFQSVGGFDETLVTDEDSDLGIRLNRNGFPVVDDPEIGARHLGNAKTASQFFRKIRWHATSGFKWSTEGRLDVATVVTFAFAASWLLAIAALVLAAAGLAPWWIGPALLVAVPLVSALDRLRRGGLARHLPQLVFLFALYYLARLSAWSGLGVS